MKTPWSVIIPIALVFLFFPMATSPAGANPKMDELEAKRADIALLHQQLMDRHQQVETLRNELLHQKKSLVAEIDGLIKRLHIDTFPKAQQQVRIRYNLELLSTIAAYCNEFDAKLAFYQSGRNRLTYLDQLALDDIKMIATLNDLKTDALTTQISLVITQYLPEAHAIQIDPKNVAAPSTQAVWDEITTGKIK